MKSSLVSRAVTAAALLLSAVPLFAQELPFNAPATDMAQQRAELLHRAAHALDDLQSNARLAADGKHIVEFRELTGGRSELQAQYVREIARARLARTRK